ncbi:MAG: SPOR domain-containing protein [Flammeovirgaceae bacterium]|nr:SPOR domain-containing protein [Flammeovirgaceae bacterium]MDW8287261.1 SPOR domain-containing protein [Flammeovirgaceae bacterium]
MSYGIKILFLLFVVFNVAGQSKKKIKAENEELKEINARLQNEKRKLEYENKKLKEELVQNSKMTSFYESEVYRLRKDSLRLENEKSLATEELTALKEKQKREALLATPDPHDKRPCARMQHSLKAGSYFPETLSRLNSKGWGIQVYSFSSLCQAVEKAKEFSQYYHMYKTYIRVKDVGDGKKTYSVVYGTLKDEQQARIYLENFKRIAQDKEGQNAFLVNHGQN